MCGVGGEVENSFLEEYNQETKSNVSIVRLSSVNSSSLLISFRGNLKGEIPCRIEIYFNYLLINQVLPQ